MNSIEGTRQIGSVTSDIEYHEIVLIMVLWWQRAGEGDCLIKHRTLRNCEMMYRV